MIPVAEQYRKVKQLETISNTLLLISLFLLALFAGLVMGVEVGKKQVKEQLEEVVCLERTI